MSVRRLSVLAVATAAVVLGAFSVAWACSEAVPTLDIDGGAPGTIYKVGSAINLVGKEFPDGPVEIRWGSRTGVLLASPTSNGGFRATVTVPASAKDGPSNIIAVGPNRTSSAGPISTSASVTVDVSVPAPSPVSVTGTSGGAATGSTGSPVTPASEPDSASAQAAQPATQGASQSGPAVSQPSAGTAVQSALSSTPTSVAKKSTAPTAPAGAQTSKGAGAAPEPAASAAAPSAASPVEAASSAKPATSTADSAQSEATSDRPLFSANRSVGLNDVGRSQAPGAALFVGLSLMLAGAFASVAVIGRRRRRAMVAVDQRASRE